MTSISKILSNLNNFHSLEVVYRVSKKFKLNNLAVKGLKPLLPLCNVVLSFFKNADTKLRNICVA